MKKQNISNKKLTDDQRFQIEENLVQVSPTKSDILALVISLTLYLLPRILIIVGIIIGLLWILFVL